jgi:hypothetical protein
LVTVGSAGATPRDSAIDFNTQVRVANRRAFCCIGFCTPAVRRESVVIEVVSGVFQNQWGFAVVVTTLLVGLAEIGYRSGRRLFNTRDVGRRRQIAATRGAVIGVLGLLLAFTFSMAVARDDARRALVVREANAIESVWLGADLLPEEHGRAVKSLLHDYVNVRLRVQGVLRSRTLLDEELRRSAEIESMIWHHADASAQEAPSEITAVFITSVQEMMATDAERIAAWENSIPGGVWLILVLFSGVGCFTTAYAGGAHGIRSLFSSVLFPLVVSVLIILIFDLSQELHGVIDVNQRPLIDLQESFRVVARSTTP